MWTFPADMLSVGRQSALSKNMWKIFDYSHECWRLMSKEEITIFTGWRLIMLAEYAAYEAKLARLFRTFATENHNPHL